MGTKKIISIKSDYNLLKKINVLAKVVYRRHYSKYVGMEEADYMFRTFQSPQAIKKAIDEGENYYLIEYKGHIVGYFSYRVNYPEGSLFISKLYIAKHYRGYKLAKFAFSKMLDIAKQNDIHRIWLQTLKISKHHNTLKAYKALGLQVKDCVTSDMGDGIMQDDYIMEMFI